MELLRVAEHEIVVQIHFPIHFSSLLISSFLLAPVVLAEHPREFPRSLLDLVEKRTDAVSDVKLGNWAGAALVQDEGTFYSVSGTLTIPELSGQQGSIGAAWVGIDSSNVCNTAFQSGLTFQLLPSGPNYNAWFQWYPYDLQAFPDIDTISPGDVIEIEVMMLLASNTFGCAIFKNQSKNQTSNQFIQSDHALCLKSAEWIVQAYDDVYLPNFGTMAFEDAVATGNDGDTYYGAIIYDIEQNGQNLTSVSVDENSVTVKYTGT